MKTFVFITLLALINFVVLPACGGLSEAEQHYNAGVELQEQGRLEEAIAEYDEAIRLDPQDADVYNNRGIAYDELGQLQRAIQLRAIQDATGRRQPGPSGLDFPRMQTPTPTGRWPLLYLV